METKSDIELKKLASRRGPQQSLAFDELARRIRKIHRLGTQRNLGGGILWT